MKLDPKHLAQLSVIVEAGSFQMAADRLGLTQPALSRNMQTLENRLGAQLFQRDGRRSVPNRLGLRLARNGHAIRLAEEQASIVAEQSSKGAFGELRIGAPPIVAGHFLSDALSKFVMQNPDCSLELRTGLVHELRTMLERGQIDFAVGPKNLAEPATALEFSFLIDDRVAVLCRADHPLSKRKRVFSDDLEAFGWLTHSRGSLLRQQTQAALVASGVHKARIVVETDSIRSALEIVAATDLITTMPRATAAPYLGDKLVFLNFDHPQFERPIGFIRKSGQPMETIEKKFRALFMTRQFAVLDK